MTFLLGILVGLCFSPPPPEAVRGALDQVLAEQRYQTELPGPDQTELPGPDEERRPAPDDRVPWFAGYGWAEGLAIVLIGAVAIVGVLALARGVSGRRRAAFAPPQGTATVAPVLDGVPLDEIESLAAAGRYDEAVHVLLLQSIAAVGRTVSALPVSLTSREVLERAPLPEGAGAELGAIVDAVETSWFGGRPVGREGFEACRERYRRFAALCGGAPA